MGKTGGHGRGLARAGPRGDEEVATVMGGGPALLGGQSGQVEHAFEHTASGRLRCSALTVQRSLGE